MRAQWMLSLLGLAASATAGRNAEKAALLRQLHGERQATQPDFRATSEPRLEARTPSEHRFLNKNSEKFVVNGSSIPEVDYDVGESYAGLLPISNKTDERDHLYFWFFPTANEEFKRKKEITIWLNGGPGCSSLLGFLQENGPFVWQPGTLKPQKNPWSFHELTNMVWIEQPVGVGFSKGKPTIKDEDELAKQFMGFWKNFVDTFAMQGYKVYITAESYGGYYGPYISSHFVNANDTEYFDLGGLMVVDGIMFDGDVQSNVIALPYVEENYNLMPFDDPTMAKIHNMSEHCGYNDYIKKYFTYPPSGKQPRYAPGTKVLPNGTVTYEEGCGDLWEYVADSANRFNPCFNIYNIPDHCPPLYDSLGDEPYFDREDVKKAINAPTDIKWSQCVRGSFVGGDHSDPPAKYELPNVIEKTNNVMLVQGAMDYILPLSGVLLGLQNMTWNGQMGLHTRPQDPFYVPLYGYDIYAYPIPKYYGQNLPAGCGVMGTSHHERGLTLVVTQLSGHEGPEFAPAAAFRQLEKLIGRVHSVSDTAPFTLPQLRNITQLPKPLGKGTVHIPFLGSAGK